jgi:acyl-CoA thioester hydrolase
MGGSSIKEIRTRAEGRAGVSMKDGIDCEIRVRYAETDQMGVAYYANYLVWFEVGRSEFCRKKGFSYIELEALGYKLVVTDVHCRYRNAVSYDAAIIVRTKLKAMNKRMITFSYQILKKDNEGLVAEGETRHLCLDSNGKPKSLPEPFLTRLAS